MHGLNDPPRSSTQQFRDLAGRQSIGGKTRSRCLSIPQWQDVVDVEVTDLARLEAGKAALSVGVRLEGTAAGTGLRVVACSNGNGLDRLGSRSRDVSQTFWAQ
jgi:hypothetical protein